MPGKQPARVVIIMAKNESQICIEKELRGRGITVQWARSIIAACSLLDAAPDGTLAITELALSDGNWKDLVERVRYARKFIPVVLLSPTRTAELWWEALECGVEDILQAPLSASLLCDYVVKKLTTEK
jgi:DNA-binding NtrC family response regulator